MSDRIDNINDAMNLTEDHLDEIPDGAPVDPPAPRRSLRSRPQVAYTQAVAAARAAHQFFFVPDPTSTHITNPFPDEVYVHPLRETSELDRAP